MRFWISGPRIGFFRPGISFGGSSYRRARVSQPSRSRPSGDYIYVIEGENNLVKVGISTNPNARLAALQTGSGFPLSLSYVASAPNALAVEQRAHEILAKNRVQGEWFDCTADIAVAAIHAAGYQLGISISEDNAEAAPARRNDKWWWIGIAVFLVIITIVGRTLH